MSIKAELSAKKAESLSILEKVSNESRSITAEEKSVLTENFARCKEIEEQLIAAKDFNALSQFSDSESNDKDNLVMKVATASFAKETNKMENKTIDNNYLEGLRAFGRGQIKGPDDLKKFALTSGANGGILMPREIPGFVTIRQSGNSFRKGFELLNQPTFKTSTDANVDLTIFDDAANTAIDDGEGVDDADTDAADPAYNTQLELALTEYHSRAIWVSNKVARAEDFDVTQYLIPMSLNRIQREENANWTADIIAVGAGNIGVTTASATAITLAELIAFDESMPLAYDDTATFYVCSRAFRTAVRLLAETTNKPFFGVENRIPTLFGKPLILNANLGTLAATNTVCMQVSVDGSVIRDSVNNEIVIYEKDSNHPGQFGVEAIGYSAFDYTGSSVRRLVMHA